MYIKSQPFYDHQNQCYYSILSLNKLPKSTSILNNKVIRVKNPVLSPFEEFSQCTSREQCLYVIKKTLLENIDGYTSRTCFDYLTFEDYPFLLDFLLENGFTINTDISNMVQNHISHVPMNILCYFN